MKKWYIIIASLITPMSPMLLLGEDPVDPFGRELSDEVKESILKSKDEAKAVSLETRNAVIDAIQNSDAIHLFWLSPKMKPSSSSTFPVKPYSSYTDIRSFKILSKEKSILVIKALVDILNQEGTSAMCHAPEYGIRIFNKNMVVFETSFCWGCNNYYIEKSFYGMPDKKTEMKELLDSSFK